MNIINMPGFTADISLYKASGHYRRTVWAGRGDTCLGVAWNIRSAVESGQQASRALVPSQMLVNGREPQPEPVEFTRCGPCNPNGFQTCTTFLRERPGQPPRPIETFTQACAGCGPCNQIDPTTLGFIQTCTTGGTTFTRPCTSCSPETRIDLPWPFSDRCIRFCCTAANPASCTVTVRDC
jgi:hypothetical protein